MVCEICEEPVKQGETTHRCISCERMGGSECCMTAGNGTECLECEEDNDFDDDDDDDDDGDLDDELG